MNHTAIGKALSIALVAAALTGALTAYGQGQEPRGGQRMAPANRAASALERQPPPSTGFSLRRLFGLDDPPPEAPPTATPPRPRPKPVARQERAKPQAENRIAVFGDWLADGVAFGLDDAFSDMANIAIFRRTRADAGLMREDWPKIIGDTMAQKQKITVAVVSLGMADRPVAAAPGSDAPEPLSDRWKELYGQRIDALGAAFATRGIPVVWVGLPPVENPAASARHAAINALLRERGGRGGGSYVDIWPGFVTEDNRYAAVGPDVGGQPARLRTSDGVHFTRKGIDKMASYTASEVRRLLGVGAGSREVPSALPGVGNEPFADIDRTILPPGEPGPAVPLTRVEVSPNGVLLKGRTDLDAAGALRQSFRAGLPAKPVKGRMDDPGTAAQ